VVGFAAELRRGMREETQVADRTRDLDVACKGNGFAAIAGFGIGESLDAGFQCVGEFFKPARTFAVRQCRPPREGGLRGGDRGIHIGRLAIGDLRDDLAGGRVEHIQPLPVAGFDCVAVDPVPVALHPPSLERKLRDEVQMDCMRPPSTAIDWPLT